MSENIRRHCDVSNLVARATVCSDAHRPERKNRLFRIRRDFPSRGVTMGGCAVGAGSCNPFRRYTWAGHLPYDLHSRLRDDDGLLRPRCPALGALR
jgi:hypothetical protein